MKTEEELRVVCNKIESVLDEFTSLEPSEQDKVLDLLEGKYKLNAFTKGLIKKALKT